MQGKHISVDTRFNCMFLGKTILEEQVFNLILTQLKYKAIETLPLFEILRRDHLSKTHLCV